MDSPFGQLDGLDALRSACAKPLIGLLGAIGSGKSTVAGCFRRLGCGVLDADAINRELLAEAGVQGAIVAAFGSTVTDARGRLDAARLAEHVFADARRLRRLTDLLHPRILERMIEQARRCAADDAVKAVVIDAPLLAEVGMHRICDAVVLIDVESSERRRRLARSRRWSAGQIATREKFQFPLDMKRRISDYTVDNSHSLQACAQQIGRVFTEILTKIRQKKRNQRTA